MDYATVAAGLKQQKPLSKWGLPDLQVWLRDKCKCAYCDKDLLESYEIAYYNYSYDHLLPRSAYKELESEPLNLVLCCWPCNKMKSTWDANTWSRRGVRKEPIYEEYATFNECMRSELIKRVRDGFEETNRDDRINFLEEQRLLRNAVKELSSSAFAAGAGS